MASSITSGALNPIDNEVECVIFETDYTSHAFVLRYFFWLFSDCFEPLSFLSIDCYIELTFKNEELHSFA